MRPKLTNEAWDQIVQDAFSSGAPEPHFSDHYCARRHEMEEKLAMKEDRRNVFQPGLVLATVAALAFAAVPAGLIWMLSRNPVPVARPDFQPGAAVKETMSEAAQPEGSVPIDMVKVPDVTSYHYEYAKKVLEQDGFQIDLKFEPTEDIDAGKVIRTEPAAGTVFASGKTVILYVSQGQVSTDVTMESYTGMTQEQARLLLEFYGFVVEFVTEPSEEPSGTVIAQSIAAGTVVPAGTTVKLTISE